MPLTSPFNASEFKVMAAAAMILPGVQMSRLIYLKNEYNFNGPSTH